MHLEIPGIISGESLSVPLKAGRPLFIVGANGSGKTALIQHFVTSNSSVPFKWISAQRQAWLETGYIGVTPKGRKNISDAEAHRERQPNARWVDFAGEQGLSATLYDLVAKENERARDITSYVDNNEDETKIKEIATRIKSPFAQINELLALSTLAVSVSLKRSEGEEILAKHKSSNGEFSIAQMSDGERNAVLLAARVLTASAGTVLLIDEPERHLHRSIIEPFLSALFAGRQDCVFVVSTHEVALPIYNPVADVLITRSCTWHGEMPVGWDVQFLQESEELPENIKRAILGARKKILFVEGSPDSLDQPLYSILFPDISVMPVGSCEEVQKAVSGLRRIQEQHDTEAFGLIDKDDRNSSDIEKLSRDYVFVLDLCAVEALYYCSDAIIAVAEQQAMDYGNEYGVTPDTVLQTAFRAMSPTIAKEMAARRCVRQVRNETMSKMPRWNHMFAETSPNIVMPIDNSLCFAELRRFNELAAEESWENWDTLIQRYPLHKSDIFSKIAFALEFSNAKLYERSVRAQIQRNQVLAQSLRQHMLQLSEKLENH